jgi:hypothetical protein
VHDADEIMAEIVAKRLVEHLERGRLCRDESVRRMWARQPWDQASKASGSNLTLGARA